MCGFSRTHTEHRTLCINGSSFFLLYCETNTPMSHASCHTMRYFMLLIWAEKENHMNKYICTDCVLCCRCWAVKRAKCLFYSPSFVSVCFIFFFFGSFHFFFSFFFCLIFVVFVGLNIREIHNNRNHIEMPVVFKSIFGSRLFDDFCSDYFFSFVLLKCCFFRKFSFWCDD